MRDGEGEGAPPPRRRGDGRRVGTRRGGGSRRLRRIAVACRQRRRKGADANVLQLRPQRVRRRGLVLGRDRHQLLLLM